MHYDLIVIGGGAAGIAAARTGAQRAARTLLITDGEIGGDCTFSGCVPSKTLIEAAGQGLDFPSALTRVRDVVGRIAATETPGAFRAKGIDIVRGRAYFTGPRRAIVDGATYTAERMVVATGSRPKSPWIPGLTDTLTSDNVWELDTAPTSLVVIGAGQTGCELAQAFARLGVATTLLENRERLLTAEEREAGELLTKVFTGEGIDVRTRCRVERAEPVAGGSLLRLADGNTITVDRVLVAVGRKPATSGLELAAAGIDVDIDGYVVTDRRLRTSASGVFAAGDCASRLQTSHTAYAMGMIAATNATARVPVARFATDRVPVVTFTRPEVARVGLTEAQAARVGGRVAYLPMSEVDRAIMADRTHGFIKLIAGPRQGLGYLGGGRLRGATVVAESAGEMIHVPALAMRTGMFAGRLVQLTCAYPTWSWGTQKAAVQFFMEFEGRRARGATAR